MQDQCGKPGKEFLSLFGLIREVHLPGGNGVRIDTAVYNGYEIPPYYDSMIAKVIVHGRSRQEAIDKMRSTLGELIIDGVTTNVDFQYQILNHPGLSGGRDHHRFYFQIFHLSETADKIRIPGGWQEWQN